MSNKGSWGAVHVLSVLCGGPHNVPSPVRPPFGVVPPPQMFSVEVPQSALQLQLLSLHPPPGSLSAS